MRISRLVAAAVAVALIPAGSSAAESSRDLAERHPAGKVVVEFLRLSVNRQWEKVAALIEPGSLETLKNDYLKRVTAPTLPFDEVQALYQAVGVADEADIMAMNPVEFYIAYNRGMQKRYNVTETVNRRIADTLELQLLSVAEEGPDLVHLLVRTKHQTMTNLVRNIEVISLVRKNSKWLVSLGEQKPKYSPLVPAKPNPAPAPAPPPAAPPAAQ